MGRLEQEVKKTQDEILQGETKFHVLQQKQVVKTAYFRIDFMLIHMIFDI